MLLWTLFWTFLKIGLFTFGGGYGMLSMIENICVEKKGWITGDEMLQITVVAESTPGPIAINCATFVGYKQAGFFGAVAATVGVIAPSFAVIYLISLFLDNFLEIAWVAKAFRGIQVAVGVLILDAAGRLLKQVEKTPLALAIFGTACAAMLAGAAFSVKISSIALMLLAGVVSLSVYAAGRKRRGGPGK